MRPRLCSRTLWFHMGPGSSSPGMVSVPPWTSQSRKCILPPAMGDRKPCSNPLFAFFSSQHPRQLPSRKRTAYFPALWPLCSPAAARAGSPPFSRQTLSPSTPAGSRLPWYSAPPTLCFPFTMPSNLPVAAAYVGNLYSRLKCKSMIEENNYFCFYCLPNTRSST